MNGTDSEFMATMRWLDEQNARSAECRKAAAAQPPEVQIRWLIRRDMADVLKIEQESFEFSWTEEDFLSCLGNRSCIGLVAEHGPQIVGFVLYELFADRIELVSLAVDPSFRRKRVGTQIVTRLVEKLSEQRRKAITTKVRETNLAAQLFLRAIGFRATGVLRGEYEDTDTDEDAYAMRLELARG